MNLLRDANFGFRLLLKDKYVSVAALATLALCIGGNATIFTMLNTLILKPLPFPESDRMVEVYNTYPDGGLDRASSNIPILLDYSENADAFGVLALVGGFAANAGEGDSLERLQGQRVTSRFFDVAGVSPHAGAFFNDEHMIQGQHRAVVLSHTFWRNRYNSDPSIIGTTIQLNSNEFEIVGVAPRSIEALYPDARIYTPLAWNPAQVSNMGRHGNGPRLFGRLRDDATIAMAKSQIDALDQYFYENNERFRDFLDRTGHESQVVGLQEERVRTVSDYLYLLQIGALFVLLIGCVNIANLLLIRSNARQTEFAIRCAIGAKPMTIGRQLLIESILLSVGGCLLGVIISLGGINLINTYAMDMLPPMQPLALDTPTMLFALGLAVATGIIVGLFPLARVFTLKLVQSLSHSSRGSSASRASQLTSSSLVCGQIAFALMLLAGAGLLIHSFSKAVNRDLGFNPSGVSTMRISLTGPAYREPDNIFNMQQQLLSRVRDIPGVEAAGIAVNVPMTTGYSYNTFRIRGYEMSEGEDQLSALHTWVSPGYLKTLGIELLSGEDFGLVDETERRRSVVIDKELADRYFPDENPIGKRLGFVGPNTPDENWPTVIGVSKVTQHVSLDNSVQGAPFMYENVYQRPFRTFSLFVKSDKDHSLLVPMVRSRLHEIDPNLPIFLSGSLEEFVDDSLNNRRVLMFLLVIFAGIAVALSAIGIYGVLAYSVSQQSREIGTRSAIGAQRSEILKLILTRGLVKTGIGLAIGLAGTFALSRLMTSMLYEVTPTDPVVYMLITLILLSVSLLASYLPARKASRIQPMEALRID